MSKNIFFCFQSRFPNQLTIDNQGIKWCFRTI